jgi:molybdate transport system substrate-binding protein
MKRFWALLAVAAAAILVLGVGVAPASAAAQPKFNVFAAASLYKAFPAMVAPFKASHPKYKNYKFVFNFQGTDTLVAQIELGAPADLFAGASIKYGTQLNKDGFLAALPRLFCQNTLCLVTPAGDRMVMSAGDLTKPGVLIAIGNAAVPIGTYTQTVLTNMTNSGDFGPTYTTSVMANVAATVANVNMVTALVKLDQVDAGFAYFSDYKAANLGLKKRAVNELPILLKYQSNPLPTYPIAVVKTSTKAALANTFMRFVMGAKGQTILKNYGFLKMPYPKVSAATPASGKAGSSVVITGTNFSTTGTVNFAATGGAATAATTTVWGQTSITATVPATLAPGTYNVTVTADGRTSNVTTFTVTS